MTILVNLLGIVAVIGMIIEIGVSVILEILIPMLIFILKVAGLSLILTAIIGVVYEGFRKLLSKR